MGQRDGILLRQSHTVKQSPVARPSQLAHLEITCREWRYDLVTYQSFVKIIYQLIE